MALLLRLASMLHDDCRNRIALAVPSDSDLWRRRSGARRSSRSASEFVIETTKDGFGYVSPAKFKAGFAHDVTDTDAAFMSASQAPINMAAFGTKLENAAWRTKPSWAVIATEDKAFDQAMLIHMAERINAKITKVSASHALFMTKLTVIADTIDQAAKAASAKKL